MRFIIYSVLPLSCAALKRSYQQWNLRALFKSPRGACSILSVVISLARLALFYQSTPWGYNVPLIDITSKSCKLDVLQGYQEFMIREVRERYACFNFPKRIDVC